MYWVGSQVDIDAAEATAAAQVVGIPEYRDGERLPRSEWVTKRWAIPAETVSGDWAIPAYDGMTTPDGCDLVESVEFVETDI